MRKKLDKPADFFDNLLLRIADGPVDSAGYDERVAQLKKGHSLPRDALGKDFTFYEHLFDVLDNKSGALLTHISIMIATTIFTFSIKSQPWWLKFTLTFILISFLINALCLIRCLRFWAAPTSDQEQAPPSEYMKMMDRELHRRSEIYRFASQLSFLTTIGSAFPLMLTIWL
jgi:hypothetical protein